MIASVNTAAGGAMCWGHDDAGQLGDNMPEGKVSDSARNRSTPVDVVGLANSATVIAAGEKHTCALTNAGAVKCWGANNRGQLGNPNAPGISPADVTGLGSGVVAIAGGGIHTCALTMMDGMKCWGDNPFGQIGDNSTADRLTPVDVTGFPGGIAAIAAGEQHTCALSVTGAMKCWGANGQGQVGDNSTTNRLYAR